MNKLLCIPILLFISDSVIAQQSNSSSILFNENRGFLASRNWAIRQNNSHEGDFQIGTSNSNTGGLPDFFTSPELAKFTITSNGSVGIGTTAPDAKLAVKGDIHTQEVRVDLIGAVAPDYVFEKDYNLLSLSELEVYINQNKHLPEVPSAKEIEENGLHLKEMNLLLLKKVEELTLYAIQQQKQIEKMQVQIEMLKN